MFSILKEILLNTDSLIGKKIGQRYIPEKIIGGGSYGTTFKGIDSKLNVPIAIKFLYTPNPDSRWKDEPKKAATLLSTPTPSLVQIRDFDEYVSEDTGERFAYIVYEFVAGETLDDFLSKHQNITQEFILQFIHDICEALAAMHHKGLSHNDLHGRNIMIVSPLPFLSSNEKHVKVIDFGLSDVFLGERKSSDRGNLCKILKQFWKINQKYDDKIIEHDKQSSDLLSTLIKKLEDEEVLSEAFGPLEILTQLDRHRETSVLREVTEKTKLTNPFEFLDVIEIPEDNNLLNDLFVPMPWFDDLDAFGNSLVSGSRGSGKSMILRYMRFKTKLQSPEFRKNKIHEIQFVGFYLHCHPSIYLPFSARQIVYSPEISDMILHYIHLQLTHEVIDTLITADNLQSLYIKAESKSNIFNFINMLLQRESNILSGTDPLHQSRTLLERELKLIQKTIVENNHFEKRTNVGYLQELCKLLQQEIEYFKNKRFFFLIDDYSYPNVSFEIQKSFNRVIRSKNPVFCFKISTEKFSMDFTDFEGKQLQQNHEYKYVDLGAKYLTQARDKQIRDFMESVLDRRLEQTGIKMKSREIFEEYDPPKGFAASLADPETTSETFYGGLYIISMLCSGDMRTLLELCKEIFRVAKWDKNNPTQISIRSQDQAIRGFSRRYLGDIKNYPNGDVLLQIASTFGEISRKYLYEFGTITKSRERYQELIRIEVEGVSPLKSDEARKIYEGLLRYSIFIDAGEGYPRTEELSTRLIFRRIFTPAFQVSYNNRECLRMNPDAFEDFLLNPKIDSVTEFLKDPEKYREKRAENKRKKEMQELQRSQIKKLDEYNDE